MSAEPDNRGLLPVACTLGLDDGAGRIGDWRRFGQAFGLGRIGGLGEVTIRFRLAPGVEGELERLVAAERVCCPFLSWKITSTPTEWRLVISGEDEALKALPIDL
jgi:hypothetical protein